MSRKYKFHNSDGMYFISFATVHWIDVFIRKEYQEILLESLIYCKEKKGMELYAWCVMPSHIHLIAKGNEVSPMSDIIRDFKKYTSKKIIQSIKINPTESRKEWILEIFRKEGMKNSNNLEYQFWQQDNHPIELWTEKVFNEKLDYLHNNPVVAGFVENPEDYFLRSARDLYGNAKGLIELSDMF